MTMCLHCPHDDRARVAGETAATVGSQGTRRLESRLMAVARRKPKPGGGRWRIDWNEAFLFYASDPTVGAREVAERFGVSEAGVRKHIRAENWPERARALQAKAAAKAEEKVVLTMAERTERTLLAIHRFREALLAKHPDDPKWSDLPPLVKLELLLHGEATERIAIDQHAAALRSLSLAAEEALRNAGADPEIVTALREAVRGYLETSAGGQEETA